jgi:excisionase family DNA binding protein
MEKGYLTTFQVAKLLSVTPDAVLKWVKSGKLEAYRTPGGHYRIPKKSIEVLLLGSEEKYLSETNQIQDVFKYCWEFNSQNDNCFDRCEDCVVFKTSAKRCYKMCNFPQELGHLKLFCNTSCENCEYYKFVQTHN